MIVVTMGEDRKRGEVYQNKGEYGKAILVKEEIQAWSIS
jgi:hypothetical protein